MSYESTAEPIKLGYLFDFMLPDGYPAEMRADLTQPFDLVFEQGLEQGIIDRPVEILYREVEGLPKGTVKAVIDAYGELVDEGCLAVFGPSITDNCAPTKAAIEERFHVPAISVTGSEEWLGEWTFSLSMGSMTDEPIFWAHLLAKRGLDDDRRARRAVAGRRELHQVAPRARAATRASASAPRSRSPRPRRTSATPVRKLHEAKVQAIVHCGFGFGIVLDRPGARGARAGTRLGSWARRSRTRGSTRSSGTPSSAGPGSTSTTTATRSARTSSTGTQQRYGRRPEYCVPRRQPRPRHGAAAGRSPTPGRCRRSG